MALEPKDTLGTLLQDTLYHLKSIEHRLAWGKAVTQLKGNDKHVFSKAVNKVQSALLDVCSIVREPRIREMILEDVNNDDRMVQYMSLVENLYRLPDDLLYEVTDLVEEHLKAKTQEQDSP
jgi:hypothetical protein